MTLYMLGGGHCEEDNAKNISPSTSNGIKCEGREGGGVRYWVSGMPKVGVLNLLTFQQPPGCT